MTIMGVEAVRRRCASYYRPKRASAFSSSDNKQSVSFRSILSDLPSCTRQLTSTTTPSSPTIPCLQIDFRQNLATAARQRLHERLRAADISVSRSSPSSTTKLILPADSGFRFERNLRLRGEKFTPKAQSTSSGCEEDDCSVCIDRLISGQIVVTLPCEHKFHSACLIPWLESHNHCPFCRAKCI